MVEYDSKIKELEDQLRKTQYNKATQHHFGVVKAQIAKLREKQEKRAGVGKSSAGFFVKKSGDATVVIVGFPSVGKSTLLNAVTGAQSKVAAYEFTTLDVVPGVLKYKHAQIQILDVPGIIGGASTGRGRGKEVLAMVRNCDVVMIVVDSLHPEHYPVLLKELYDSNVRVNQQKPDVQIMRRIRGGLHIDSSVKLTKLTIETMNAILREFRIANADIVIREDIDMDQLIDVIEANRSYVPSVVVVSKIDLVDAKGKASLVQQLKPHVLVSCEQLEGIDALKDVVFDSLHFMRIFLKEVNKKPDLDEPMILRQGVTFRTVCEHIHRDFVKKFRFAKVWGKSAKFPGQQFRDLDKKLSDGDVVELHLS